MQLTFKHGRLKRSLEEMASSGLLKDLDGRTILWGISQIYLNTAEVCSWPYTKYNTCHAKSCTQSTTIKGQKSRTGTELKPLVKQHTPYLTTAVCCSGVCSSELEYRAETI